MVTLPTATPSAAEASAAVPRVFWTVACTAAVLVDGGTRMVKVSSTLAELTVTRTRSAATPARSATIAT